VNDANQYGRLSLKPKPKMAKGCPFHVNNLLYVDNRTFFFNMLEELTETVQMIHNCFALFGL